MTAPADRLRELIVADGWMMGVLDTVRASGLPDAWVGAGAIRDLVWDTLYGSGFDPSRVRDVDVPFFDAGDLRRERDEAATALLRAARADVAWEAKNQAAVHTWYRRRFGGAAVAPLRSIEAAVATWPETATSVALRRGGGGRIEICAPLGLDDLLGGVWRRNPARAGLDVSLARLARQRPGARWPGVRVVEPAWGGRGSV